MSALPQRSRISRSILACLMMTLTWMSPYVYAETAVQAEVIERAKRATVGILEDTQDPRTPDKPGKIKIRGTGFHLKDGYIVTARHAVEKNSPAGHIVPKIIHVLTTTDPRGHHCICHRGTGRRQSSVYSRLSDGLGSDDGLRPHRECEHLPADC